MQACTQAAIFETRSTVVVASERVFSVSVQGFSSKPSAMFARVEQGEAIEVTRHSKVIAVLLPGAIGLGRYFPLVAKGVIRLKATTTADLDQLPAYDVPADVSPLDLLLEARARTTGDLPGGLRPGHPDSRRAYATELRVFVMARPQCRR